jgi:hypothetical protein
MSGKAFATLVYTDINFDPLVRGRSPLRSSVAPLTE